MNSSGLKFAVRALARRPGFAIAVALTLGLGIGVNVAVFSAVDAVMLRPLPFQSADRLAVVWETMPGVNARSAAPANFMDWRRESRAFSSLAGFHASTRTLMLRGNPERVQGVSASANLFETLGVTAALGRVFVPTEDSVGTPNLAVVTDAFWRTRLGANPAVIGTSIELDGRAAQVIGVLPRAFRFLERAEVFTLGVRGVPALAVVPGDISQMRDIHYFDVIGRLAPRATVQSASAEIAGIAARQAREFPSNAGLGARAAPLREVVTGDRSKPLLLLLAAVGFVLLIACTNIANLFMVQAASREREFAIRAAIGAPARRLLRQSLTESLVLGVAGGAVGLIIAYVGIRVLATASPIELSSATELRLDARVAAFAAIVSVAAGALFGLIAAAGIARMNVEQVLRGASGALSEGRGRRRTRGMLAITEIALSMMLLAGAGLFLRGFQKLSAVEPGFRAAGVTTFDVELSPESYAEPERRSLYFREALRRTAALPAVVSAGVIANIPASGASMNRGIRIEGRPAGQPGENTTEYQRVGGAYFESMGIGLVAGRLLTVADGATAQPVAVVNQALVARYFAGENPLGRQIGFGARDGQVWRTIVGVVSNVRQFGLAAAAQPEAFVSVEQDPTRSMTLVVRTSGVEGAVVPMVREALRSIDPAQPISNVLGMEARLADSIARPRFLSRLLGAFALAALLLASIGIYAVMSSNVQGRRREMGVRLAVGASPRAVLLLVLGDGARLVAIGVAGGLVATLAASRLIAGMLFGVPANDVLTLSLVTAMLVVVAMGATLTPALRAAHSDPLATLRGHD